MAIVGSGSCICGDVKYTFTEKPMLQVICHCHKCRKFSASTNTTFLFLPRSSFNLVLAETPSPSHPSNHTKTTPAISSFTMLHESGMVLRIHWCARCGTKIYKQVEENEEQKDVVLIAAGTLDAKKRLKEGGETNGNSIEDRFGLEDVKLDKEFYVKDRVEWLGAFEGVQQCQEFV